MQSGPLCYTSGPLLEKSGARRARTATYLSASGPPNLVRSTIFVGPEGSNSNGDALN